MSFFSKNCPQKNLGLYYLVPSYKVEPPQNQNMPGLTNANVDGITWRESWDRISKNGVHAAPDWAWLDNGFALSRANNKGSCLQVLAGQYSPASFFSLPGAKHITVQATGNFSTVPFDPVFQTEFQALQTALAARYKNDSSLKYVVLAGTGVGSESFFAINPTEVAE